MWESLYVCRAVEFAAGAEKQRERALSGDDIRAAISVLFGLMETSMIA